MCPPAELIASRKSLKLRICGRRLATSNATNVSTITPQMSTCVQEKAKGFGSAFPISIVWSSASLRRAWREPRAAPPARHRGPPAAGPRTARRRSARRREKAASWPARSWIRSVAGARNVQTGVELHAPQTVRHVLRIERLAIRPAGVPAGEERRKFRCQVKLIALRECGQQPDRFLEAPRGDGEIFGGVESAGRLESVIAHHLGKTRRRRKAVQVEQGIGGDSVRNSNEFFLLSIARHFS